MSEYIKHYVLSDSIVRGLFKDGVKVVYSNNNIVILSDTNGKNKIAIWSFFRENRDKTREIDYTFELFSANDTIDKIINYIKTVRGDNYTVKATKYNYRKQMIKRIRNNKNAKYVLRV